MPPLPTARFGVRARLVAAFAVPVAIMISLSLMPPGDEPSMRGASSTLGVLFGGTVLVSLLVPPLALAESGLFRGLLVAVVLILGTVSGWIVGLGPTALSSGGWAACFLVLSGHGLLAGGVAMMLRRLGMPASQASALAVIAGIAWLCWPIWLAPYLTGEHRERTVARLVILHPLFTINGAAGDFVPWAEHRLAYSLTTLGDDIAYEVPRSILPFMLAHGLGAAALWGAGWMFGLPRKGMT